jgi:hypothetical protein
VAKTAPQYKLISCCSSQILDDERDSTVGGVELVLFFAEALIGESTDLRDLIVPNSMSLHQAPGGIGAVLKVAADGFLTCESPTTSRSLSTDRNEK